MCHRALVTSVGKVNLGKTEAMEGAERGILVPALIENTKIPLRFRPLQAADLVGWDPQGSNQSATEDLISAVARVAAKSFG